MNQEEHTPFLRRDILGGLGSIAFASMLKA